jgi:hypothetical protein
MIGPTLVGINGRIDPADVTHCTMNDEGAFLLRAALMPKLRKLILHPSSYFSITEDLGRTACRRRVLDHDDPD